MPKPNKRRQTVDAASIADQARTQGYEDACWDMHKCFGPGDRDALRCLRYYLQGLADGQGRDVVTRGLEAMGAIDAMLGVVDENRTGNPF